MLWLPSPVGGGLGGEVKRRTKPSRFYAILRSRGQAREECILDIRRVACCLNHQRASLSLAGALLLGRAGMISLIH